VTQAVSLIIGSEYSSDSKIPLLIAYVLPKLMSFRRRQKICKEDWPHLQGLQLADPDYDKPSAIDVVFGADIYARLMKDGFRSGCSGEPIAHRTMLSWVLMGGS